MFRPQDLRARLQETPFVRFELVLTTGEVYAIDHPELVLVGQRELFVGLPSKEDPTIFETATRVALLHVVELRDLPAKAPTPGNGPA